MEKENKKKGAWRKPVLIALCVLLSLILVLLIFAAVFMDRLLGSINRVPDEGFETLSSSELQELVKPDETRGEDYTGPVYNADDITMPTEDATVIESEKIVNIMLVGQDRRGGTRNSLTDVMMLCTINKETKTLTMTSFLRDLYLKIPGYMSNKLNQAYPVGGFKMLNETLEVNFGVKVDGNVEVDFSQFSKIIELLGGVEIELTGAEAAHLNGEYGFSLRSGVNRLNGEQALAYARIRKIDSDFYRTNRQRNVITAILNQFKNASLAQITDTLTGVLGMITTDMTDAEILGYAVELAPLLKDLTIVSQHIPAEGTYYFGDVEGTDIVDCIFIRDFEANRALLADVLDG